MIVNTPSSFEGVFFVFKYVVTKLRIICKSVVGIELIKMLSLKLTEKSE